VTEAGPPLSAIGSARSRLRWPRWSVPAAALLFLLPWLGRPALFDRDETYYAEAAREMRLERNWLVPRLNGREFRQKPFLPLALICASYSVFGVNETGARMPSALLGLGTILLTAAAARLLFGEAAALRSAWILGSSLLFLLVCRSSMTDSAFLFFFTWSLFAFVRSRGTAEPRTRDLLPMYVAMGLAALCKGPVGFLLPMTIIALVAWSGGGWASVRRLRPAAGSVVILSVAAVALLSFPGPDRSAYLRDFLLRENVGRFLSPMEGHRGPFWIYAPVLLIAFLPWSPFLPAAWKAVRDRKTRWILGAWVGVPFLFFSAAATKLPHYLLPVFPALAILVAAGWEGQTGRWSRTFPLVVVCALTSVLPLALFLARARWPDLLPVSLVWTAAALPAGALTALLVAKRPTLLLATLAASVLLFIWLACGWSLPALQDVRVIRPIGIQLRGMERSALFTYRFLEPGLLFYGQRTIEKLETLGQVAGEAKRESFVIVVREAEVAEVRAAAGVPLKILVRRQGFCEDSGPLGLVVLAR
jgi:4-amino-4-deoxy-L-arabinose transferase-like glycosyltransferase